MADQSTEDRAELVTLIKDLLGEAACAYVQNKNRGGSNGKKGTRFEDFYTVFQVAKLACANLDKLSAWPSLESQILAFVDDLVISETSKKQYFQLKNVASLVWDGGEHPLAEDFRLQFALSTKLNEPSPTMTLVVADPELKARMEEKMPSDIEGFSSVEYFPDGQGSLNKLVFDSEELRDVLVPLARKVQPSYADLEGVFGVLMVGCLRHSGQISIDAVLRSAKECIPNMLAALDVVDVKQHVTNEFVSTLDSIPGLAYAFDKGIFSWTAFGTSAVFGVDCASEEFKQFQNTVVKQQPKTFDEFEGLLP